MDLWARRTLGDIKKAHQARPASARRNPVRGPPGRYRRLVRGVDCVPSKGRWARGAYETPRSSSGSRRPTLGGEPVDLTDDAAAGGRRGPVVVADDLAEMELRGDGWRVEMAAKGRGVKRKRQRAVSPDATA